MMTLQGLRSLDLIRMDINELVEASTAARLFVEEFTTHRLDVPEWLDARRDDLGRALKQKRTEQLSLRVAQTKVKLRLTMTREERRSEAEQELAELEAELNAE